MGSVLATILLALAAVAGACAEPGASRYLAPGTRRVGGVRHLCLIYHGQASRVRWTKEALLPYVTHVDEQGKPTEWLFDSFLLIEFGADSGASLMGGKPQAAIADWQWLADAWFRPDTGLAGLESAVAEAGKALGDEDHRVNVVITVPSPSAETSAFGPLPGETDVLDFGSEPGRQRALAWYVDEVLSRWRKAGYRHLRLAGFYWVAESIPHRDDAIVEWLAGYVHERRLRLYWIPYFGAEGVSTWRERGIDATMLQPNHFFTEEADPARLLRAARMARTAHSGIEIEFDGRALTSDDYRQRFYAYLDAGVKYRWMTNAVLGYYEGGGAIKQFVESPGQGRELYEAVCRFVKGTYEPSGEVELESLEMIERDIRRNLALASRGATIEGCARPAEYPDLAPEKIIDGDIEHFGGMSGFGYFAWPGSFTIRLPRVATVARTQTMLFDLDGREFTYRIDTSLDGEHWEPAVDKSEGGWVGWQVDAFTPRRARLVRFTGLHNSVNALFQVVEFEVYPTSG